MWLSSAADPGHPSWLVIDLDPPEDNAAEVRAATVAVRDILDRFGLDGFPVATGSKGYHVWVPVSADTTMGDAGLAARAVAGLAASLIIRLWTHLVRNHVPRPTQGGGCLTQASH